MESKTMEEAILKVLKILVSELFTEETDIEKVVDNFLQKSELTISPASREDLIKHIYYTISMQCTE